MIAGIAMNGGTLNGGSGEFGLLISSPQNTIPPSGLEKLQGRGVVLFQ
jgi:hypothetical protein